MLSPSHPLRYFVSYQGRRWGRVARDAWRGTRFARERLASPLPCLAFEHASPIFRRLAGVAPELQANKRHNLSLVLPSLDGLVLAPGEVFSFWRHVGPPTAKRGFREGLVIQRGHAAAGTGGGLCQLSNALFWCALHTDLRVIERHRHGFDLFPDDKRSVPFGLGAAVAFGVKDLRFENHTPLSFQFRAELQNDELHVSVRASAPVKKILVEERDSHFYRRGEQVFRKNQVVRKELPDGAEEILYHNDFECRYAVDPALVRSETLP